MSDKYFISEWALKTKSSDIRLNIYTMPQKHREIKEIEKATANMKFDLRKANNDIIIESAGYLIGSFIEIKDWLNVEPLKHECRCINTDNATERRLLERLLSRHLEQSQPASRYFAHKNMIIPRNPQGVFQSELGPVHVRRYLKFDLNVYKNGVITVGFDLFHRYTYNVTVFDLMKSSSELLNEGLEVIDKVNGRSYRFLKVLDKPISFPYLPSGENLLEYYSNIGLHNYVKSISPDTPAVDCLPQNEEKPLQFIPQLLVPICSWSKVPKEAKSKAKLPIKDRMKYLSRFIYKVTQAWIANRKDISIKFKEKAVYAEKLGYRVKYMKKPTMVFGNGVENTSIYHGFREGGVVSPPNEPLECQLLIDYDIAKEFTRMYASGRVEFPFVSSLEDLSSQLGVVLKTSEIKSRRVRRVNFSKGRELQNELHQISPFMRQGHPVVIVATEEHLNKKYGDNDFYSLLKRELGHEYGLSTQVIKYETTKVEGKGKNAILMNILLGLYVKAGIHPWKLKSPLHADCFIGLDVSHDEGVHTTGIIQVVGKDGTTLWTKPLSNSERGEVIRRDTLEQAIHQAIRSYHQKEGQSPKRIIFHRDGRGHVTEINIIEDVLAEDNIDFDYVAIVKSALRRMAYKDYKTGWKNPLGCAYIRKEDKMAYLCSTDPKVGMAVPIKITQYTNSLNFNYIIEDIYHLTYMNVHSLNKSRLPVTVNYADKSFNFFFKRDVASR